MQQYICDRCGDVIPLYNHRRNHIVFYDKGVKNFNIVYQDNHKYNECDLCDECLELLNKINESFISYDRTNEEILGAITNDRY